MPRERIYTNDIEEAVQRIIPYLVDTSNTGHRSIYIDGWRGLAASAVLRAIAEDPPPSLLKKFNKIIHVDCSKWKSRRALQRTITQELKLPHWVMDILDRQDEDDDFIGVDESSRAEVPDVGSEIHQALGEHRCLVVFHNGSDSTIDLNDFGIPHLDRWSASKVLWTFRGRLRLNSEISKKVDNSHLYLYDEISNYGWNFVLKKEAREIAGYTDMLDEAVEECCLYLLSLNSQGGNIMDYNWATHASNYWVCDGIIQGGQGDEAWEVASALHQHINIDDYSSNALPSFGHELETPKRWILSQDNFVVHPESTSFFLAAVASQPDPPLRPLPNDMFHQSEKLRVLKLCHCSFSFSSPPFHCCTSLRFLGLDGCKDQRVEDDDEKYRPTMEFFQSLWVLEICYIDWELDLSPEIIEQMAANIREVHIKNGRFWHINFAWRRLQNLRKLRVIEPTCPWETGQNDEFTDMVKMEYLDLSGNSTIKNLPSLSGATCLKDLVLDGCVGLEHVGPETLPSSLESFSLDVYTRVDQNKEAKISHISLAGCGKLMKFRLCGSLPNLVELDLSGTLVKTLDLKEVQAPSLQQIILLECLELRAILWPAKGLPTLTVLHIDPSVCRVRTKLHEAYVIIMDIRIFHSLVLQSDALFCWKSTRFYLNLYVPCTTNVKGQSYMKEKMGCGNSGPIMCPPQQKSLTPNTYNTYIGVSIGNIIIDHQYNNGMQFQPSGCHVEIGKGISNDNVKDKQAINAILFAMNKAVSLHVHENSSITTIIPEHMMAIGGNTLSWEHLKQCHVERCPKMHTVFTTNYHNMYTFEEIEIFWAADLLNAHCIWSKGRSYSGTDYNSFGKLKSIHLYSCLRLTFVLPLLWGIQGSYLHNLESLHIVNCGDLKTVFPVHPDLEESVLEFPSLKHIHLYELYKLQHICKVKMLASKLERVWLRGCWGLRRLPAIGQDSRRPIVDCEQDWWEKLEWDGLEAGHDPCLFERRHSSYYKKPLPRVSVLR